MCEMFPRISIRIAVIFGLLLLFTALFVSQGCRKQHPEKVILISIDALRADFLGCYNPAMKTSPHIDRIAKDGILCMDVISQAPSTALSHKSILYSLYPSIHKTSMTGVPKELTSSPLEILQSKGFKTAAFVGGGQLSRKLGFAKGFDTYWEPGGDVERNTKLLEMKPLAFNWLENNYSDKFFLFLHTYQVHCPYFPPEEYRKKYASWYKGSLDPEYLCQKSYNEIGMTADDYRFVRDLYAAEVNYVDDFIGELVSLLKRRNIYDQTILVILSDHGESLGERGFIGHNQFYSTQLRIPLILRVPGISASRISSPLQSIDVIPTIFDALGLGHPFPFQGKSIQPLLKDKDDSERYRISEKDMSYAVQKGKWKAIFYRKNNDVQLYDMERDPEEWMNVAEYNRNIIEDLSNAYGQMQKDAAEVSSKFVRGNATKPELDPELREELKALGYVQ